MTPPIGWYTFVHDFLDFGVDAWLDEVRQSGADHVNVAAVYHTARDVLPRNPRRRIRYLAGGLHYFRPRHLLYPQEAQPAVDPDLAGTDPLPDVIAAAQARGVSVNAWAVLLHNSRLGQHRPDLAQRNVFGDRMLTDLCPSHPTVRKYAVAVAADVCRLAPSTVLAESLHFHGLRHGFHHERYLFELGNLAELALSLCFCQHCISRAANAGVDASSVEAWARGAVEAAFAGTPADTGQELSREAAVTAGGAELGGFLDVRAATVTTLASDVHDTVVKLGSRLAFLDPSGAVKGWVDGAPTGRPVVETGWQFGIDVPALSGVVDAVEVLGYTADPERLAGDLQAYRFAAGDTPLRLSIRPGAPDSGDAADLARKLELARSAGVEAVDLYHLGLLPASVPRRVRTALNLLETASAR
jgi:hypothetical protein